MSHEERDSQLSAMFDDELPTEECELLARRLARDPALQARWGRYAAIGACIRGQAGVRLQAQGSVAEQVRLALAGDSAAAPAGAAAAAPRRSSRWLTALAGAATAAGVATISILWLRAQSPVPALAQTTVAPAALSAPVPAVVALAPAPAQALLAPAVRTQATQAQVVQAALQGPDTTSSAPQPREFDSYVVPPDVHSSVLLVPPAQNANYQGPTPYQGPLH